ncbi:MAG: NAD(P)H-binding protein [Deltaproteobacteria bacterium]|nr:NAD(P)H-binding protein [Deltaproteobacteria bacterium]
MHNDGLYVVTGAFGYSGKYIALRLLKKGAKVRTITDSPDRLNPFGGLVEAAPFNFGEPDKLAASLSGAKVLYNTYWVRFNSLTGSAKFSHSEAVRNTLILFNAAQKAGVKRIVHVSITNPDKNSTLEYFRGKAVLEQALVNSGISYSILRPAVLFGQEDILINNIAWMLRKFPVFGLFGEGSYRLQPIFVDDLARLAVEQGGHQGNTIIDAIGPETFSYRNLVSEIGSIIGKRRPIVPLPPWLCHLVSLAVGKLMKDVLVTKEEIEGLMDDLLYVDSPPAGSTRLTDWAKENRDRLGIRYASELARRRDRKTAY